mgnify:FL=1
MSGMFSDLLLKAQEQSEKQRLLFLFAKTDETNKSRKREDKKGSIEPKMVVDKLPDELSEFSALVKEADGINKDWDFVFIASLGGDSNTPPTTEAAEPYLNKMTNDVMTGNNIFRYVVFDRNENPIEITAN